MGRICTFNKRCKPSSSKHFQVSIPIEIVHKHFWTSLNPMKLSDGWARKINELTRTITIYITTHIKGKDTLSHYDNQPKSHIHWTYLIEQLSTLLHLPHILHNKDINKHTKHHGQHESLST